MALTVIYGRGRTHEWQQSIRHRTRHAGESGPERGSAKRRPHGRGRPGSAHEIAPPPPRHQGAPGGRHRRPGERDFGRLKGAFALNPRGKLYTEENVKDRLAVRDLLSELRDGGLMTGGPPAFGKKDCQAFADQLDRFLIRRLKEERF